MEFNVSSNLISIKLFTYARCTEALEGGAEYNHGILNLTVKPKPTIVKLKNGKTTEILEVADCDCPYELFYELTGVQSISRDSVWINMMSIPLINRNARHVEIDVIR